MAKRKSPDYLEALGKRSLEPARRVALHLLRRVHESQDGSSRKAGNDAKDYCVVLDCVNCDKPVASSRLYCGDYCQQLAATIRYVRKALADGRIAEADVQSGIGIRLLMLAGGGYPSEKRKLSAARRAQILKRDGHQCKLCGAPATEIDHIKGDSDNSDNLRALCKSCNGLAAWRNAHVVSLDTDPAAWRRVEQMYSDLAQRIASSQPLRFCDNQELWNVVQGSVRGARRELLREREEAGESDFEDVDGYLFDAMQKDD